MSVALPKLEGTPSGREVSITLLQIRGSSVSATSADARCRPPSSQDPGPAPNRQMLLQLFRVLEGTPSGSMPGRTSRVACISLGTSSEPLTAVFAPDPAGTAQPWFWDCRALQQCCMQSHFNTEFGSKLSGFGLAILRGSRVGILVLMSSMQR